MSDLISRKALIEELKNPPLYCSLGGMTMEDVFEIVKTQPTAYDVDNVVEQLQENAVCSGNKESGFILLHKAVTIVKGGDQGE